MNTLIVPSYPRWLCLPAQLLLLAAHASSQIWPQTRAEKTDYRETSHYSDVIEFLADLQRLGAPISMQMIGASPKGKPIPLVVASFPRVSTALQAKRLGRPIVYVQANIHAGEVEGKEAILGILRRLSQDGPNGLLGKIVLIVAPIYNIDGNEAFGSVLVNRPEQDGPDPVGQRSNGGGLDLNRDAIKAEAPETRALLATVYRDWDPEVMMDLHTTDGTRHGWDLTYAPGLNPNTDLGVMGFTRDRMLPTIRKQLFQEDHLLLFDYGNQEHVEKQSVWATYGQEGRYCTNYVGLRNRISILSEATAFIPFKARVLVTDRFVSAILKYVAAHSREVLKLAQAADENVSHIRQLGVRFALGSRGVETVLLESKDSRKAAERIGHPPTTRPTGLDRIELPIDDRFKILRYAKFPAGYLIRQDQAATIELLKRHGVLVEKVQDLVSVIAEEFQISEFHQAAAPFQGHRLASLEGHFSQVMETLRPGDFFVSTSQPLGVLAFHILEPEGADGALAWGFLGEKFPAGTTYPIVKLLARPPVLSLNVD